MKDSRREQFEVVVDRVEFRRGFNRQPPNCLHTWGCSRLPDAANDNVTITWRKIKMIMVKYTAS